LLICGVRNPTEQPQVGVGHTGHGLAQAAVARGGGGALRSTQAKQARGPAMTFISSTSTQSPYSTLGSCQEWPRLAAAAPGPVSTHRIKCVPRPCCLLLLWCCSFCAAVSCCRRFAPSCPCSPAAGPGLSAAAGGAWVARRCRAWGSRQHSSRHRCVLCVCVSVWVWGWGRG
jgi:hypothetical protein